MTRTVSALLPVLRSETQARLLAATLLRPDRETSIAELARQIGADAGNLHTDVARLITAGILVDRRVGRSRLVRAGTSPLVRPLQDLLLIAYGPKTVLEQALAGIPGLERAVIVGSWAARYTGQPGALPHDVDLVVIGTPDRDAVTDKVDEVSAHLGREVQVIFRSPQAWEGASDSFTATVRTRPQVDLDLNSHQDTGAADDTAGAAGDTDATSTGVDRAEEVPA
jgi:DNA-binding transcriptional ArsR family regulator